MTDPADNHRQMRARFRTASREFLMIIGDIEGDIELNSSHGADVPEPVWFTDMIEIAHALHKWRRTHRN